MSEYRDQLEALLPALGAPGISARQAHANLGLWAPATILIGLRALERDGRAVSILAPGPSRRPTRFFRRAEP